VQVFLDVKKHVVVERYRHTYIVERGSITLHAFYSVGIGMEDIGVGGNFLRCGSGSLLEIVVVSINTSYHALPYMLGKELHQHGFLATLELACSRGEHNFEINVIVLKLTEYLSPEKYVVIALHISYDLMP
jgi:hypothetical protein